MALDAVGPSRSLLTLDHVNLHGMNDSRIPGDSADSVTLDALWLAHRKLEQETENSVRISERNIGIVHTGRQNRALFVFAKLILHNMSVLSIAAKYLCDHAGRGLLDHFSIGTLGRASIDACLMTLYISTDGLSRDSWNLRRNVLYLHDLTTRKRFLSALCKVTDSDDPAFFESYPSAKAKIIENIERLAQKLEYSDDVIADLKKGQRVFIDGARGAVREAGLDVDLFDFQYSYLSAHVHSHPVSFMRGDEHNIKFEGASRFQINFVTLVLDSVFAYTNATNLRMDAFTIDEKSDHLGHIE